MARNFFWIFTENKPIRGLRKKYNIPDVNWLIVIFVYLIDHIDGEEIGQLAIITRTNVTLFREAVRMVEADTTTMIAFAGVIILRFYHISNPQLPPKKKKINKKIFKKY